MFVRFLAFMAFCLIASHARQASTRVKNISPQDLPQLIVFTHDDNTDKKSARYVTQITDKLRNPNGCKIKAAFFTTAAYSDCKSVMSLYEAGHEIAEHTKNHKDLYQQTKKYAAKKKEILGGRDFVISCGVPKSEVVGHRSPYLSSTPSVRKILSRAGYLYDATIPEYYPSKTSPSGSNLTFPYLLSEGIAQDCKYWDNINHCQASESYSNLWELPLYQYQKGPYAASTSDLMDPENPYDILKAEFNRRYKGNRAPLGIWTHTSTGYLKKKENRKQISKFLKYALRKPDVWVVTPRQLIDFMKNPVKADKMASFLGEYKGC